MDKEYNNKYINSIAQEILDVDINDDIPLVNASLIEEHVISSQAGTDIQGTDFSLETIYSANVGIGNDELDFNYSPSTGGSYDETEVNDNSDDTFEEQFDNFDGDIIDDFDNTTIEAEFNNDEIHQMRTDLHQNITQDKNESVISEIVKNIINRIS